jgi:hypothetical protein
MQRSESSRYNEPLDVLRRFIPTPLRAMYRIQRICVTVETNDFALLPALPLQPELHPREETIVQWKLIRDDDSRSVLEPPRFLTTGNLTVVEMGTACLLGIDHERRELLGFIGAGVDARTYQEFLVPFLCEMAVQTFSADRDIPALECGKESAND